MIGDVVEALQDVEDPGPVDAIDTRVRLVATLEDVLVKLDVQPADDDGAAGPLGEGGCWETGDGGDRECDMSVSHGVSLRCRAHIHPQGLDRAAIETTHWGAGNLLIHSGQKNWHNGMHYAFFFF